MEVAREFNLRKLFSYIAFGDYVKISGQFVKNKIVFLKASLKAFYLFYTMFKASVTFQE